MAEADASSAPSHPLIESDHVEGTVVYNTNGKRIGTIKRLVIEKVSGHVAYAVTEFGGFLGLGSEVHTIPWEQLHYDTSLGGYKTNITEEQLRRAPEFSRRARPAHAALMPAKPELPHKPTGSLTEGVPDFTTAAAAGELLPGAPTVTEASPDMLADEKLAPELAGSDLQPVEGRDPQGGGPREPIPRPKPETDAVARERRK